MAKFGVGDRVHVSSINECGTIVRVGGAPFDEQQYVVRLSDDSTNGRGHEAGWKAYFPEDGKYLWVVDTELSREPDAPLTPAGEHAARKAAPLFRGALAYFPDALLSVARVSRTGNEQHHPGEPIHWAYGKSMDHGDCILRHQADYESEDTDGELHAAKVAWRALAQLQTLLEKRDPALHAKRQAQRDRAARGER